MRGVKLLTGLMVASGLLAPVAGCVSLGEHRKVQAANRMLIAEKEELGEELYNLRTGTETLRTRIEAQAAELQAKDELLANLRRENDLLHDSMKQTADEYERLAAGQGLPEIAVTAKLPEPLDSALKSFAQQHPSMVAYDPASGSVKWKGDVLFAPGSDVVKDAAKASLRDFAGIAQSSAAEGFEVVVVGHTDDVRIGKPETKIKHPTNWHLSAHRAYAVAEVLLGAGDPASRLAIMGCGEYRPVADNSTEDGKSRNRRVEIYLIPAGSIVPTQTAGVWQAPAEGLVFARLGQ